MKKVLLTTLVVVLALIVLVIWLRQDEPPTPEAQAWQQWHDEHHGHAGEAYLWLLGFGAPAGENPQQAGARWLDLTVEEYERSEEILKALMTSPPPAPWQDQALAMPDSKKLDAFEACRDLAEPPCDEIEDLLGEHAVLLARFRDWPVESESLLFGLPASLTPMSPMTIAVRLDRVDQLRHLLDDQAEQASAMIREADQKLRAYLGGAPSLISLMVATRLLADQTDWLLALKRDGLIDLSPDDPMLAAPEGVGRALEASFRHEFGLIYRTHQEFDINHLREEEGWPYYLAYRWFYKPGMSTNESVELNRWLVELDEPGDLSALGRGDEPIWRGRFQLRNLFGYGNYNMLPSAEPALVYVGRVHDLSAKLALARAYLSEPQLDDAALRRMVRANPYRRGYGVELDEQRSRLCFDGPFEDTHQFRCLDVPLHDD